KSSRDSERSAPRSRREKTKSSSGMLPVLLALLGLGAFAFIGCGGAALFRHFAATKRPGAGKKDFAAKDKKDGAVKIDGLNDKRPESAGPRPCHWCQLRARRDLSSE